MARKLTASKKWVSAYRKKQIAERSGGSLGYMAWIKTLGCICCGTRKRVEAAHCGKRPFGQKCSDYETLPICQEDHTEGKKSVHKLGPAFWEYWQLDRDKLFEKYQTMYKEIHGEESISFGEEDNSSSADAEFTTSQEA